MQVQDSYSSDMPGGAHRPEGPTPLKRGRHHLPPEAVRASQRERMMAAAIELVAEHGFPKTTVRQIVGRARVSFTAFSENFADKADCFLAACEEAADELLTELYAAASSPTWVQAVNAGTQAYLRWWSEHPAFARAYFLGLPLAGSEIAERGRNYEAFRGMYRALAARARGEQPELAPLQEVVPAALVHAISGTVADRIRQDKPLPALQREIVYLVVKLLGDEATARAAIGE